MLAIALCTFTVTVQEAFAGIVAPVMASVEPPAIAATVPPHVVAPAGVVAFTRLAGYVFVNAMPVIAEMFEFVSVTVSSAGEPMPVTVGVNARAADGCAITVSVAVAPAAVPAFVVVTLPVELGYEAAVVLVVFTVIVHDPLAGTVAPESTRLAPLLAAVTVPPTQVVVPEAEAVFTRPAGYVSVNAAPVTAVGFGFVSVIVRTLVSLVPIEAGVNDLATVSWLATTSVSFAATVLDPAFVVVRAPAAIVFV